MSADQQFIQVLEEESEKYCDFTQTGIELSGWVEHHAIDDLRISLASQGHERRARVPYDYKYRRTLKPSVKRTRIPLLFCDSSYSKKEASDKKTLRRNENVLSRNKYFPQRRKDELLTPINCQNPFQITTISLQKPESHKRNKSLMTEKRHSKLESYYDRSFLIMKKSPPTVSGYSVTFYYK